MFQLNENQVNWNMQTLNNGRGFEGHGLIGSLLGQVYTDT